MDNPVFVYNYDIPHIDDENDYEDDSRYDTSDTSRIEATSFTEQPSVRLKPEQRQRLLHEYVEDLYKNLEADPGNVDLWIPNSLKLRSLQRGWQGFTIKMMKIKLWSD